MDLDIILIIIIGSLVTLALLFLIVWTIMAFWGKDGKAITNFIIKNEGCSLNELSCKLNIKIGKIKFLLPWILFDSKVNQNFYYDKAKECIIKGVKINNQTTQSVCSMLEYMLNEKTLEQSSAVKQEEKTITIKSNKEQLQELKEMLEDGLITQEDFEKKKKQILGL